MIFFLNEEKSNQKTNVWPVRLESLAKKSPVDLSSFYCHTKSHLKVTLEVSTDHLKFPFPTRT